MRLVRDKRWAWREREPESRDAELNRSMLREAFGAVGPTPLDSIAGKLTDAEADWLAEAVVRLKSRRRW